MFVRNEFDQNLYEPFRISELKITPWAAGCIWFTSPFRKKKENVNGIHLTKGSKSFSKELVGGPLIMARWGNKSRQLSKISEGVLLGGNFCQKWVVEKMSSKRLIFILQKRPSFCPPVQGGVYSRGQVRKLNNPSKVAAPQTNACTRLNPPQPDARHEGSPQKQGVKIMPGNAFVTP